MRAAAATLALGAVIAAPGAASAAYAPKLSVRLDPATPLAPAALDATITQAPGEDANRSMRFRFPPQFGFNPGFSVSGCTPREESAGACPEGSRIGTARVASEFGPFSGPVYFATDYRLIVILRDATGVLQQKLEGYLTVSPDGSVESVLDELPDVRATEAAIRLEPGARSLLLTPRRCGDFAVEGSFLSHGGARATSRAPVEIRGCDTEPAITVVSLTQRALLWQLSDTGAGTEVTLERLQSSKPWLRWRRVASLRGSARAGANRLPFRGRIRGKPLRPGRYRFTLSVRSVRGVLNDVRSVGFRIRRPARA